MCGRKENGEENQVYEIRLIDYLFRKKIYMKTGDSHIRVDLRLYYRVTENV